MTKSNYDDVGDFHKKFDLPSFDASDRARFLDTDTAQFRIDFMQEELDEFKEGLASGDLAKQADSLVDLVYVALGTAQMMNLPWQDLWAEVQRANISKERATGSDDSRSKRKNSLDVVKPEGWTPPDIEGILSGRS